MFWFQNHGSSIWGSRDIKRFRTRHTYDKIFFCVFRNQVVMKRGEMHKNFFDFSTIRPIAILSVLNVKVKRAEITLC